MAKKTSTKKSNPTIEFEYRNKTYKIPAFSDLPRRVRRAVRNALMKAAPDGTTATEKIDMYLSAYDAGLAAANHVGANIDPNDEALSVHEAQELDDRITAIGVRLFNEMNDATEDEPKNEVAPEK